MSYLGAMRKAVFFLTACAIFAAAAVQPARAYSFVGTWHATISLNGRLVYDSLVLEANGRYNELDRMGTLMTENVGEWSIQHGMLYLNVLDWQPKEQCLQTGCFPIRKPPGSLLRVWWLSGNSFRAQDVNMGGYITYVRV